VAANWARPAFAGVDDIFETLHSGLTVKLVSTPRHELKTCKWSELVIWNPSSSHYKIARISLFRGERLWRMQV
jgi:hypothetical protein